MKAAQKNIFNWKDYVSIMKEKLMNMFQDMNNTCWNYVSVTKLDSFHVCSCKQILQALFQDHWQYHGRSEGPKCREIKRPKTTVALQQKLFL